MPYFPCIVILKATHGKNIPEFYMFARYIIIAWNLWEEEMENKKKFRPDPKLKIMDQSYDITTIHTVQNKLNAAG